MEPRSSLVVAETVVRGIHRAVKDRGLPVGHVSTRSDGKYEKQSDGSWEKISESSAKPVKQQSNKLSTGGAAVTGLGITGGSYQHRGSVIKKPTAATHPATWNDKSKVATFVPQFPLFPKELNGVGVSSWKPPEDWSRVDGQKDLDEPPLRPRKEGQHVSAGVIIEEPDGRIWLVKPTNHFGGYRNTFPKGTVEDGLSPQVTAIKEAWEESGLKVEIDSFVGDYEGTTSVTRYYKARRSGGTPADMGWETQAVRMIPKEMLKKFLNASRDRNIAEDIS